MSGEGENAQHGGSIPFPISSPRSRPRDSVEGSAAHSTPVKYRRGSGSVREGSAQQRSLPSIRHIFALDGDDEPRDQDAIAAAHALMSAQEARLSTRQGSSTASASTSEDVHSRHASAIAMLTMASSQSQPEASLQARREPMFQRQRPPFGHTSMGSDPSGRYSRPSLRVEPPPPNQGSMERFAGSDAESGAVSPGHFRRRHTLGAADEPPSSPGRAWGQAAATAAAAATASAAASSSASSLSSSSDRITALGRPDASRSTPRAGKRSFGSHPDSPTTPTTAGEASRRHASDATPMASHIYLRGPDAPTGSMPSLLSFSSPTHARNRFSSMETAPSPILPNPGNLPQPSQQPPYRTATSVAMSSGVRRRPPQLDQTSSRSDVTSPRTSAGALSFASSGWHSRSSTLESVESPIPHPPSHGKSSFETGLADTGYGPGSSGLAMGGISIAGRPDAGAEHPQTYHGHPHSAVAEQLMRQRFENLRAGETPVEAVNAEISQPGTRPRARTMSAAGRPMARLPGTAASQLLAAQSTAARTREGAGGAGNPPFSAGPSMQSTRQESGNAEGWSSVPFRPGPFVPGPMPAYSGAPGAMDVDSSLEAHEAMRFGRSRVMSNEGARTRPISPPGTVFRPISRESVASASGTIASGLAKYECSWCGKRFSRPSSLKIHHHSHTGDKPYVCHEPGCGRAFSVQSNLRRHQKCHGNSSGNTATAASTPARSEGPDAMPAMSTSPKRAQMLARPASAGAGAMPRQPAQVLPPPPLPMGPAGFHTSTSGYPMPFAPVHTSGHPPISRSAYEFGSRSFAMPWPSAQSSGQAPGTPGAPTDARNATPRFAPGPGMSLADAPHHRMSSGGSGSGLPPLHPRAAGPARDLPPRDDRVAIFTHPRDRRQSNSSSLAGDDEELVRVRGVAKLSGRPRGPDWSSAATSSSDDGGDDEGFDESPPPVASAARRQRRDTATSSVRLGFEGLLNPEQ